MLTSSCSAMLSLRQSSAWGVWLSECRFGIRLLFIWRGLIMVVGSLANFVLEREHVGGSHPAITPPNPKETCCYPLQTGNCQSKHHARDHNQIWKPVRVHNQYTGCPRQNKSENGQRKKLEPEKNRYRKNKLSIISFNMFNGSLQRRQFLQRQVARIPWTTRLSQNGRKRWKPRQERRSKRQWNK